jgi:hypothetical protein
MTATPTLLETVQTSPAAPATRFCFVALGADTGADPSVVADFRFFDDGDAYTFARALVDALHTAHPPAAALFISGILDALSGFCGDLVTLSDTAAQLLRHWGTLGEPTPDSLA